MSNKALQESERLFVNRFFSSIDKIRQNIPLDIVDKIKKANSEGGATMEYLVARIVKKANGGN